MPNPSIERTRPGKPRRPLMLNVRRHKYGATVSWDVSIHKFSRVYRNIEEIPPDETLLALGSRAFVHERIQIYFPDTDWSDPSWGVWGSPDGSVEFNLGKEEPATGLMLHVRANETVIPAIVQLCIENNWQGIDCSSGEFLEQSSDPAPGLVSWSAYRDQIVRQGGRDA